MLRDNIGKPCSSHRRAAIGEGNARSWASGERRVPDRAALGEAIRQGNILALVRKRARNLTEWLDNAEQVLDTNLELYRPLLQPVISARLTHKEGDRLQDADKM